MPSTQRKPPSLGLQRRVRARVEAEPEPQVDQSEASEEESADSAKDSDSRDGDGSDSESEDQEPSLSLSASQLSFGALAKAQANLHSGRTKRGVEPSKRDEEDDEEYDKSRPTKRGKPQHRSSKHAPAEMSSRFPVSRRRNPTGEGPTRPAPRDPRFLPAGVDNEKRAAEQAARNYAFIDEYRDAEVKQLKEALRAARAADKKKKSKQRGGDDAATAQTTEQLERALKSLESKKKAADRARRVDEVQREQRAREKELVAQGKQPFFLKRAEQKKMVLVEQFASMKKGQVDKTLERRRKKLAAREKKTLPMARRGGVGEN